MQRRVALCLAPAPELRAQVLRDGRHRRDPLLQQLEVEARSADEDRDTAGGARGRDLAERRLAPPADRAALCRGQDAIEPMRRGGLLGGVRARAQHPQLAVDLHRIGVDDGPAELAREAQRKRRLARGGRPSYGDDRDLRPAIGCRAHAASGLPGREGF